jgi:CheY-like chemotaxis protein
LAAVAQAAIGIAVNFPKGQRPASVVAQAQATVRGREVAPSATTTVDALISNRPLRVLVAEDNAVNQLVLKTLLAQVGVQPEIVADGHAAVDAWTREPWDLILMDVQMPGMDGPTAARAIRAAETKTGRARTPIVALTAKVMPHQISAYVDAGMDAHVPKPIEASALFSALRIADVPAEREARGAAAA